MVKTPNNGAFAEVKVLLTHPCLPERFFIGSGYVCQIGLCYMGGLSYGTCNTMILATGLHPVLFKFDPFRIRVWLKLTTLVKHRVKMLVTPQKFG